MKKTKVTKRTKLRKSARRIKPPMSPAGTSLVNAIRKGHGKPPIHDEVGSGITDASEAKKSAKLTLDQALASFHAKQPKHITFTEAELVARLQEAHRQGRECVLSELKRLGRKLAHVADQMGTMSTREAAMAEKKLRDKAIDIEVWLPQVEENARGASSKTHLDPWLLREPEEPLKYDHLANMDTLRMTQTGRTQAQTPNVAAVPKSGPTDIPPPR